jgi:hypothetical protein
VVSEEYGRIRHGISLHVLVHEFRAFVRGARRFGIRENAAGERGAFEAR